MIYLHAVYLDKLKRQATMIKERNNWSTQLSFGRGSGFKARNKRLVQTKHLLLCVLQTHGI